MYTNQRHEVACVHDSLDLNGQVRHTVDFFTEKVSARQVSESVVLHHTITLRTFTTTRATWNSIHVAYIHSERSDHRSSYIALLLVVQLLIYFCRPIIILLYYFGGPYRGVAVFLWLGVQGVPSRVQGQSPGGGLGRSPQKSLNFIFMNRIERKGCFCIHVCVTHFKRK